MIRKSPCPIGYMENCNPLRVVVNVIVITAEAVKKENVICLFVYCTIAKV
jgi:hypothetical protein